MKETESYVMIGGMWLLMLQYMMMYF